MGRTKSPDLQIQLLALCILKQKLKADKVNIAKISANKLANIGDPHSKLRKAVLINNVIKKVGKEEFGENVEHLDKPHNDEISNNVLDGEKDTTNTHFEQEKFSLCDDIISEFLDIRNDEKSDDSKMENNHQHQLFHHPTSPYSYNSFLSEVNKVQNIC